MMGCRWKLAVSRGYALSSRFRTSYGVPGSINDEQRAQQGIHGFLGFHGLQRLEKVSDQLHVQYHSAVDGAQLSDHCYRS